MRTRLGLVRRTSILRAEDTRARRGELLTREVPPYRLRAMQHSVSWWEHRLERTDAVPPPQDRFEHRVTVAREDNG